MVEWTFTTEFNIRAVIDAAREAMKRESDGWRAGRVAQKEFDAMYPEEKLPHYESAAHRPPVMVDHSMGYMGVAMRDDDSDRQRMTFVFTHEQTIREVYVERSALEKLRDEIQAVLDAQDQAVANYQRWNEMRDAWTEAKNLRQEAREKVGQKAESAWKRAKGRGQLINVEEETDEDGIPF